MAQKIILGIDLGTTNSCMAYVDATGAAQVIPNAEGFRTTPSMVAFSKKGELLVGSSAKRQAITNPESTIFSAKRMMGQTLSEVSNIVAHFPFKVQADEQGKACISNPNAGRDFLPEQIAGFLLKKLKEDAEAYLNSTVEHAVITVPAYFSDRQRQATKDAGALAGLQVLHILNEPTAAALAYGVQKEQKELAAVFDLGGGTFDVTILKIGGQVFDVQSTNGDTTLGGDDWDHAIVHLLADELKARGVEEIDPTALQRLKEEGEKAKINLSSSLEYEVNLPFITSLNGVPLHLQYTLTRAKLEQITKHLLDRTIAPIQNCLKDANLRMTDLHQVILVGGMTRMPCVRKLIKDLTGREPHRGVNPDEVVAMGAAIQGASLAGDIKNVQLLDVTPLTLGLQIQGGLVDPMIPRNTKIPTRHTETFTTSRNRQTTLDLRIVQGERPIAAENKLVGHFQIQNLPEMPAGRVPIEVTMEIDRNGILHVRAVNHLTQDRYQISVDGSTFDEHELSRLRQEAEAYSADDLKRKQLIEAKNALEAFRYQMLHYGEIIADWSVKEKRVLEEIESQVLRALQSSDIQALATEGKEIHTKAASLMGKIFKYQKEHEAETQPIDGKAIDPATEVS